VDYHNYSIDGSGHIEKYCIPKQQNMRGAGPQCPGIEMELTAPTQK
jgi:hypothetical protein